MKRILRFAAAIAPATVVARLVAPVIMLGLPAAPAAAEFGVPGSTPIQEKVVGALVSAEGDPTPEAGDQIGAFVDEQLVGVFSYTSSEPAFAVLVFGDNPETADIVEGAKLGQKVTFRFFDSSTDKELPLSPVNAQGELSNYLFAGSELVDLPVPLPGLDLVPTRQLNLAFSQSTGGGDGGAGDGETVDYDVNQDGKVDNLDAAEILHIVIGGSSEHQERADVDGDGVISSRDAIAVIRAN